MLDHFLIEPFYPHAQSDEFYVCIHSLRPGDEVLFYHEGGVDVGDVDAKASRMTIGIGAEVTPDSFRELVSKVPAAKQGVLCEFLAALYTFFRKLNYSYLEINPIVVTDDKKVVPLDLAAKIDETARVSNHNTQHSSSSISTRHSSSHPCSAMLCSVALSLFSSSAAVCGARSTSLLRSAVRSCPPSSTSASSTARLARR